MTTAITCGRSTHRACALAVALCLGTIITQAQTTDTWNGGGADANWMTAGNWLAGTAPNPGDDLVFAGSAQTSPNNNFAVDTLFGGILFAPTAAPFTLSGNEITLGGLVENDATNQLQTLSLPLVLSGTVTFTTSSNDLSGGASDDIAVSALVSGTGSLTKNGNGTLILGNKSYGGGTTVNGGMLVVSNDNGGYTMSGGALLLEYGSYWSGPTINFTANAQVGTDAGRLDFAGSMGAPGYTWTKIGAGTLNCVYWAADPTSVVKASAIDVAAGTLGSVWNGGNIAQWGGTNVPITVEYGAALEVNDGIYAPNYSITLNGGTGTGNGALLAGRVNAGNANLTNTVAGTVTLMNDSTVGTFGGIFLLAGNITGPGGLTQVGSANAYSQNTLVLAGTNTYGGNTTINSGTLQLGSSYALLSSPTNGTFSINGTSTLDLNGFNASVNSLYDDNAGTATINNSSTSSPATFTVGGNGGQVSFVGAVMNSGSPLSLVKIGTGSAQLLGLNTYNGSNVVTGGSLEINIPTGTTTGGPLLVADGATLTLDFRLPGSSLLAAGATFGATGATALNLNIAGFGNPTKPVINATYGSGVLSANGTITVTLTGNGAVMSVGQFPILKYTSRTGNGSFSLNNQLANVTAQLVTNVANHSIDVQITSAPVTTWVGNHNNLWDINTTANWKTLGVAGTYEDGKAVAFDDTALTNNINLTTALSPAGTSVVTTNNYTFGGAGALAAGDLTKGGSGTLTVTTVNSYNNTIIASGTLQLADGANGFGTLGNGTVDDEGILVINSTNSDNFVSIISGGGQVVNQNTNTLTLNAANTYTGGTVINQGVVKLGTTTALGAPGTGVPMATVANGGTLDINGKLVATTNMTSISGRGYVNGALINSGGGTCIGCGDVGVNNVALTADAVINATSDWVIGASGLGITGNGFNLTKLGGSTVYLRSSTAGSLASFTVGAGGVLIESANPFGTGTLVILTNNANLDSWGNNTGFTAYNIYNNLLITNGGGTIRNTHGHWWNIPDADTYYGTITLGDTLTVQNSSIHGANLGVLTIAGPMVGSGPVLVTGPYLVTLSGANTYTGNTTISSGTLAISAISQGGGAYTNNDGATLDVPSQTGFATVPMSALTLGSANGSTLALTRVTSFATAPITATNLTLVGANIVVLPASIYAGAAGEYPVIKYTTLNGAGSLSIGGGVRGVPGYLTNDTANSQFALVVPGGTPVIWTGAASTAWDINTTANWSFNGAATTYQQTGVLGDAVTFNDSSSVTNVNLTAPVSPTLIIVNNTNMNYTFSGSAVSNATALLKEGTGMLLLNNGANPFTGGATVLGGTLQLGNSGSLNNGSGTVTVSGNGAVDFNNQQPTVLACTISGTGFNGLGTLVQNSGANNDYGPGSVTMAGSATVGGANRWDLRNGANTFNTPTNAFTLTKVGVGFNPVFVGTKVSANLGDIYITAGMMGYETGTTGLGNPTNTIYISTNATLEFYQATVPLNKFIVLSNGASLQPDSGGGGGGSTTTQNIISGPIYLAGPNGVSTPAQINCNYLNGCAISNTISGPGGLTFNYNAYNRLYAPNTYVGDTSVLGGVYLYANASIVSTNNIYVNVGPLFLTNNASVGSSTTYLNDNYGGVIVGGAANLTFGLMRVGGATLDVTGRTNGTLTLTSGETLRIDNGAIIKGNIVAGAGSTVAPGGAGYIQNTGTNFNNLTFLSGSTAAMDISVTTATNYDAINVVGNLAYGGTLTINRVGATPLSAGQSFKLFNAGTYSGSFAAISTNVGGQFVTWDASQLPVSGTLTLVSATAASAPTLLNSLAGNTLTLNWPPDHQGWQLYSNSVGLSATSSWFPVAGSSAVTNAAITMNPTNPQVFFQLRYP